RYVCTCAAHLIVRTNISIARRVVRIGRLCADGGRRHPAMNGCNCGTGRFRASRRARQEKTNMLHRRHTLVAGTVLAMLTPVAAACGGRGSGGSASPAANNAKSASPATVAVANSDLGNILVASQGRTLYQFGADTGTKSKCSGDCAADWPPLIAHGNATVGNG